MPPPGGRTKYAMWEDPGPYYPVHYNPVLVKDLEPEIEAESIKGAFEEFGEVSKVHFPNDGVVDGKAFCFVWFKEDNDGAKAIEGLKDKYSVADGKGSDAVLMAYKKQLKAKFGTKPGKEAEDATATIFQTTYESTSQAPMVMSS